MNTITFCGGTCEVVRRYKLTKKYMKENNLAYKDRIVFRDSFGEHDCADTFTKNQFIGKLVDYKRLNNSSYGNPAYYGTFESSNGLTISGRTASNAADAYGFLNNKDGLKLITYHTTKSGNIIFDYVREYKGV